MTTPTWEGLHPLVVHFPIVLLTLPPLFLAAALWRREPAGHFTLSAWALLVLGTSSAFLARASGAAAETLVSKNDLIDRSIQEHAEAAFWACLLSLLVTLLLTAFLWVSNNKPGILTEQTARKTLALILVFCLALVAAILKTGHEGSFLVHALGLTNPGSFPPPGP